MYNYKFMIYNIIIINKDVGHDEYCNKSDNDCNNVIKTTISTRLVLNYVCALV